MTTILAIDAAYYRSGICLLQNGQVHSLNALEIPAGTERATGLAALCVTVGRMLKEVKPDYLAIETSLWQRDGHDRTATIVALSQARAATLIAARTYSAKMAIIEMTPHDVRLSVCGNRNASKEQVQAALQMRDYDLPTMTKRVREGGHLVSKTVVDPDIADALALGLSVWANVQLEERAKGATP